MQNNPLLRTINDSGYPLQVAVQQAISSSADQHGWQVRSSEQHWESESRSQSGFVDVIAANLSKSLYALIECKRVRDADWIVFRTDGQKSTERFAKVWLDKRNETGDAGLSGWASVALEPACPEVGFCAVRGQDTSSRTTLLERIAAEIALAAECYGRRLQPYGSKPGIFYRVFVPIIVTTAKLHMATFEAKSIQIENGTLPSADFLEVPYVRFQKQLGVVNHDNAYGLGKPSGSLEHWWENTVFVVNAAAINDLLSCLSVNDARL